jgi:hypothetical protein
MPKYILKFKIQSSKFKVQNFIFIIHISRSERQNVRLLLIKHTFAFLAGVRFLYSLLKTNMSNECCILF